MRHTVVLATGNIIDLILPSGNQLEVVATPEVASVAHAQRVLYSEERYLDDWRTSWPEDEPGVEVANVKLPVNDYMLACLLNQFNSDNGATENLYSGTVEWMRHTYGQQAVERFVKSINATDGSFYIRGDAAELLTEILGCPT